MSEQHSGPGTPGDDAVPVAPESSGEPAGQTVLAAQQPLPVSSTRIIEIGLALWTVALVATLVVPALHDGDRTWWPWTCVAGLLLGVMGYAYVRRGRGNAADADH